MGSWEQKLLSPVIYMAQMAREEMGYRYKLHSAQTWCPHLNSYRATGLFFLNCFPKPQVACEAKSSTRITMKESKAWLLVWTAPDKITEWMTPWGSSSRAGSSRIPPWNRLPVLTLSLASSAPFFCSDHHGSPPPAPNSHAIPFCPFSLTVSPRL